MHVPFAAALLQPRRELIVQTLSLTATAPVALPVINDADRASVAGATSFTNEWRESEQPGTSLTLRSVESASKADSLGPMALYPDPILRRSASPVTKFGHALEKVVELLVDGMKTSSTTALQYGIDARIVVLKGAASPLSSGAPLVLINPAVLSRSGEDKLVYWKEYCGDVLRDDFVPVEVELMRDDAVEVAAQDVRGIPVRKVLQGEAARAFQHELDHLNGLLIVDHAGLDELPEAMAVREAPYHGFRQRRAFERRTYQGNEPLYW